MFPLERRSFSQVWCKAECRYIYIYVNAPCIYSKIFVNSDILRGIATVSDDFPRSQRETELEELEVEENMLVQDLKRHV